MAVAVCCSVLQCVAVCCSVLQCVAVSCCRLLACPRLGTNGTGLLEMSGTSSGCLVTRAILVQISQNMFSGPMS